MLVLLDEAGCPVARQASPWDRLMGRIRAPRLDSALAAGASPDATVALALRARALVSERTRRDIALGAQRLLALATQAPVDRSPVPAHRSHAPASHVPGTGSMQFPAARRPQVPVCRDRIREAAEELDDLIRRLRGNGPVAVRGMALASLLLTDGSGPLYRRASPDDAPASVREAVLALDPLTA